MAYKRVYICDECGCEGKPAGTDAIPELPLTWWSLRGQDYAPRSFCSLKCVVAWAREGRRDG